MDGLIDITDRYIICTDTHYILQELRFEDYTCNRKGSAGTGGIFTSQPGGLMGGASGTGLFSGGAGGASKKQEHKYKSV